MQGSAQGDSNGDQFSPCIAIIGAGFSGIGMAIRLQQHGYHNFTLYEAADRIGGTWRDNTYPGCACDVASHVYSFSFAKKADWSHVYSGANEIYNYLLDCVEQFNLHEKIKLNSYIADMRFDQRSHHWHITTAQGQRFSADILINGTGPLNKPLVPDIPGLSSFRGEIFHSSDWHHDCDLTEKSVAVIGTGASAIQFVPKIVNKLGHLSVFQRSPTWIVPRFNRRYAKLTQQLFKRFPALQYCYRNVIYWRNEYYGMGIIGLPVFNPLLQKLSQLFLFIKVRDVQLRQKLSPSYQFGCKRINISDDYYDALQQSHVELVTEAIASIDPRGINTADGQFHPCDAIILGTGFITQEQLQPMKIFGLNNLELTEVWKDSAKTYLGISVAGFPNQFLLLGPNTGLGHNSVIFMIEAQINYVLRALDFLKQSESRSVDVKADTQADFCHATQALLKKRSWGSGCKSWYLSQQGENYTTWPGLSPSYWRKTRKFNSQHYHVTFDSELH